MNAKYSVSFCLPFLSGTLPPPELFTADLEEELKELRTELRRQRAKGERNMCIGSIQRGKGNMQENGSTTLHPFDYRLGFLRKILLGKTLSFSFL